MSFNHACMEFLACAPGVSFKNNSLIELLSAVERSAIHIFGWPIALVIRNEERGVKPEPKKDSVEFRWNEKNSQEFWYVNRTGEFYFIGELFENERKPTHIFLDTRTNRVTETFMRIYGYYKLLKVADDQIINISIIHKNIIGRILGAASPYRRFFEERKCTANEVKTDFSFTLSEIIKPETLKSNVYRAISDLAEKFDFFQPNKEGFVDSIVEDFLKGRIS